MKKTISVVIAAVMMFALAITSFADISVGDQIPDAGLTISDFFNNFVDLILGFIGTIAGMFFK